MISGRSEIANMNKTVSVNNLFFFSTFTLMLISQFSAFQTTWVQFTILGGELRKISVLFSILLLLQSFRKYTANQSITIFFLSLLVLLVAWNSGYTHGILLWLSFVLIIGAKGIEFKTIVKYHLLIAIFLCLVNISAHFAGWCDKSLIFMADERENMFSGGIVTRFSGGYPAATDFATHLLYMVFDIWILVNGKWKWKGYAFLVALFFFVIVRCDARQTAICVLLVILCSVYINHVEKKNKKINIVFVSFLVLCVPCFFAISLYATLSYDNTNIMWVAADIVLSGRLQFGNDGIQEFGITWFGQNILLIGGGFTGVTLEYNYIDNAYVQFLLRWGVIIILVFLLMYVKIGLEAQRQRYYLLLFSIFVASISAITTQFLFYPHYNVLIFAITSFIKTQGCMQNDNCSKVVVK